MAQEMDLSSFMAVLIMTIGCLVILLVTNVVVIISNPENLSITTLMPRAYESADNPELASQLGEPFFANKSKETVLYRCQSGQAGYLSWGQNSAGTAA